MKNTYIIGAVAFSLGLAIAGGGYSVYDNYRLKGNVDVKGLSERVVRADLGKAVITFSNKYDNLKELYSKRIKDKETIINFLKESGFKEEEIINTSMDTDSRLEEIDVTVSAGTKISKKQNYFESTDKIFIETKDLSKIEKVKSDIISLSNDGIFVSCTYNYILTNFAELKISMLREASEIARKNAEEFIKPQNAKLGKISYLHQGEVSIRASDEAESINSWDTQESKSVNKKVRLVVSAGFRLK